MEYLRHKKNTSEGKKYFPAKIASENSFKNVDFTYKSKILKYKI